MAKTLDDTLSDLASEFAGKVADAVRASMLSAMGVGGAATRARNGAPKRAAKILCPVDGCGKPGGGPRLRWFCREHFDTLTPAQKKKAMANRARAPRKR